MLTPDQKKQEQASKWNQSERGKAYKREWLQKNREQHRQASLKYYQQNRERVLERNRERYRRKKERLDAKQEHISRDVEYRRPAP